MVMDVDITMNSKGPQRSLLPKAEPGSFSTSPILDALPTGGEAASSKRRCISSACMPCRKRKSKCDGVHPACHACRTVYNSPCNYDIDSDHRRKGALKRDIAQLKDDLGPRNIILEALRNGTEADADDILQLLRARPDDSFETIAAQVQRVSRTAYGKSDAPSAYLEGALSEFSKETTGTADKPGDATIYGHTSNLDLGPAEESFATSGIYQLGTWTDVTNDTDLIGHLLDVYLTWSHPLYMLLSEEVFMHGMQEQKLKYCTPMLVNATLAVACHFSDRPETRAIPSDPSTVGDHFFAEAERLFREDSRPCLTTVQALATMSLHQAMNSRDSPGWLYICQAIGMAIELGLNKDQSSQPSSKITASEMEARRITFWGCYFLQTVWTICVGRISILPRTAIRVERPNILENLELKPWKPHGHSGNVVGGTPGTLEQPGYRYTILSQAGQLCEVVDDIVQMFYAPRERVTSFRLQVQHEKLQKWYAALPPSLGIKEHGPTLPQVICLHMFYYNCMVHLFRPFLKVNFVHSNDTTRQPKQIATEAANKISELLRLCVKTYGLRRVGFMYTHTTVTAGIIHILNVSSSSPDVAAQSQTFLCEAIRALHEMQSTFPITDRFLRSLRTLCLTWCGDQGVPPAVQEAWAEVDIGSPESTSSSDSTNSLSSFNMARKASALGILPDDFPPIHGTPSVQQNLFWTPFPELQDGMPLVPLGPMSTGPGQHMDITSMLDPIDGDWPELNQDGFTMRLVDDSALWDLGLDDTIRI